MTRGLAIILPLLAIISCGELEKDVHSTFDEKALPDTINYGETAIDSLNKVIEMTDQDSNKVNAILALASHYSEQSKFEAAIVIAQNALKTAEQLKWELGIVHSLTFIGTHYNRIGNNENAISYLERAYAVCRANIRHIAANDELAGAWIRQTLSVHFNFAYAFTRTEKKDEVIAIYEQLLNEWLVRGSPRAIAHLKMGRGTRLMGDPYHEYSEGIRLLKEALIYWEEKDNEEYMIRLNRDIAHGYELLNLYPVSIKYAFDGLRMAEEAKDTSMILAAYHQLGNIYKMMGEYEKALDYFLAKLPIQEPAAAKDEKQKGSLIGTLINIGTTYGSIGQLEKALEYHFRCIELCEEINNWQFETMELNNIAIIYEAQGEFDNAIEYLNKAIGIRMDYSDELSAAWYMNTLGSIYTNWGKPHLAMESYSRSLEINERFDNLEQTVRSHYGIAAVYQIMEQHNEALKYAELTLKGNEQIGRLEGMMLAHRLISEIAEQANNPGLALPHYKKYTELRDSLSNEGQAREIGHLEAQSNYDKQKSIDDKDHEKQLAVEQQEKEKQQVIAYSAAGGLLLVVVFLAFVFNRLRVTRKQKRVIEMQKDEVHLQKELVEEKNQEIVDSIQYAKRIQNAILPSPALIKQHLKESFVLYKPKDIVAGDFYWLNVEGDKVFFTAADCTGHGVPGAMLSVMCSYALTRAMKELEVHEPGKILDKAVELLEEHFSRSEEEVNDGMDLALCCLNLKTQTLDYAGANSPLYRIRDGELDEIKPDKQPIGKYDNRQPFTNHSREIKPNDCYYVFTDGFADQFGGPKGKKFKYKPFKELLIANHAKPMGEQKEILNRTIEKWRGEHEQVDDICVIGVRI